MTDVIRVMVVDSSAYVRCRLTFILNKEPDIQVVGTAPHGARVLALAQELQPHVILLALKLNDCSGLTVLDDMMHTHPTPIVVICGGTHDAAMMAHVAPAAMLFVRCRGGVSHHPAESVEEADVAVAIDALERLLRAV